MYIVENPNTKIGRVYCYASECLWDKQLKKYHKPRISVGHLEGVPPVFVPNRTFELLLLSEAAHPDSITAYDRAVINTVKAKYGDKACLVDVAMANTKAQTAWAVFSGPSIVFGDITARYNIESMLKKAFGDGDAQAILSLAWYIASEGGALSNSDVWLDHFENPAGDAISSQEITRLLDRMDEDGVMTFYKLWLNGFKGIGDKTLYDLTSISWYRQNINMVSWGHNRDNEDLPQVNYALLCSRDTGMPLFAWPLDGSVSDERTLHNTLQFMHKLGYMPGCIMMDRGFGNMENISYMFEHGYTFFQALHVSADWVYNIIDAGNDARLRPNSALKTEDRTYYTSTSTCQWVKIRRLNGNGDAVEETFIHICKEEKMEKYIAKEGEEILSQYQCIAHVLFCQDLIGSQWDKFMEKLNREYERLIADENTTPASELKSYFLIEKKKWASGRTVDFNTENIANHRNKYAGFICFLTNDKTIPSAKAALEEYLIRDYIEKDFDELKNDLDTRRIGVHTDDRMKARLLIQFISEIYVKEIRTRLRFSSECRMMTRNQISAHINGIYKIKFAGKDRDVCPELSKSQRSILDALGIRDTR
ncbi:MAG: hypothetical protein FWH55_10710 [Oscillospiraceae bacterium]|nr:hypothetical protein [Oscillospiraceae bacterium]